MTLLKKLHDPIKKTLALTQESWPQSDPIKRNSEANRGIPQDFRVFLQDHYCNLAQVTPSQATRGNKWRE